MAGISLNKRSFADMDSLAAGLGDSAFQERAEDLRALVESDCSGKACFARGGRASSATTTLSLKTAWSEHYGPDVSLWPENLRDALATIEAGVGFSNFSQNLASAFQNLRLYEETVAAFEVGIAIVRAQYVAQDFSPASSISRSEDLRYENNFIPDSAARAGLSFISSPFSLVVPIWVGGAFGRVATAGIARAGGLLGLAEGAASAVATSVGVAVESAGFVATSDAIQYVAQDFSPANIGRPEGLRYMLEETLSATFVFGGLRVFGWMGGLAQALLPATETGVAVAKLVGHAASVTGLATMEEVGEGLSPLPKTRAATEDRPYEDATFYEKLWRALFLHTTINSVNGFMNFNGAGNEYGRIKARANDIKRLIEAGLLPQNAAVTTEGLQIKIPARAEFSTSDELKFWNEGSRIMFPFFTHTTNEPVTMAIIGGIERAASGGRIEELKVLEIGSHDQSLAPILEQRFPGIKVIQSDFAKAGDNVKGTFIRADAFALPIHDGALDLGISSFVAEYVAGSFAEMHRVLRPGGHAVMVVHSKGSDIVRAVLDAGKAAESPAFRIGLAERIEKAAFASEGDLKAALGAEGFDVVSIETIKDRGFAVVARKPQEIQQIFPRAYLGGNDDLLAIGGSLRSLRSFAMTVMDHLVEGLMLIAVPQSAGMMFAIQPGKDGIRVLTRPQIDAIHNNIAKLRALGGKRALAEELFASGRSLLESSCMKAEGENYINEAVALFDELGLAESAGDGLFELCKYYSADMRNRSGTLRPALRGTAERYEKAAVEAATPKDAARAKEKARQAWIRYARFHGDLGDQKDGNKIKRGPAPQDDYRTAAEAYGRAGDTESRDNMAMKQGSVSLDQAGKLMAAMDAEDYRDGGVDLSQLLGYCRSARDGFMTASASKDPRVASKARRDLEGTVRLSAAVWTNVLDNNRPHISSGLAAMSNPSADAKVQTIRPDYGALKVYPKAIAGLGADIAEAEGLGMMGLKRQAEKTRSAAIAEYVKLTKAVVARAMRGRAPRISARFYKHAARMYRNLGMEAEAKAVEAELAGLNEADRDRGGRQPAMEPQGTATVAEFLKLAEKEKNPPRKFELLKRAAEQSERNGGLAQAIEIYGRLAAITDYRNLSYGTRVEAFENIARLSEMIGDTAGYREACVRAGDSYERWKDAHSNFNVPEKMEKAAEWYMRGQAYDRAVSALIQKAEALFPDGLAAAYKIAVATETLKSFKRNVTREKMFQACMKSLDTLRSALDIAEKKSKDPQRAGEIRRRLIVRLRELNAMSFDTIAKFKDIAEKIADGRTAQVSPLERRHVIYLLAVDGVRFVSGLAKALGVEGKLPYDPAEKYKKERPTAERLKAKLDHGSAGPL